MTPRSLFGRPWAPRTDPSVPKGVPREPQRPTKCPQGDPRGPKGAPRRPKGRPKETPKPPPRHPKSSSKRDPEPGDLISSKQSSRLHGNPPQKIRRAPVWAQSRATPPPDPLPISIKNCTYKTSSASRRFPSPVLNGKGIALICSQVRALP